MNYSLGTASFFPFVLYELGNKLVLTNHFHFHLADILVLTNYSLVANTLVLTNYSLAAASGNIGGNRSSGRGFLQLIGQQRGASGSLGKWIDTLETQSCST